MQYMKTFWNNEWKEAHKEWDIPNWDEYFMAQAMLAATRSPDTQWQAGCLLVKSHVVLGTGYNGFPPGLPDHRLPNTRPLKYKWIIHSEANAIYNAKCDLSGSICYTNGQPCVECAKAMYGCGIKEFVCTKGKAHMVSNTSPEVQEAQAVYEQLLATGNIKVRTIELNKDSLVVQRFLDILEKSG